MKSYKKIMQIDKHNKHDHNLKVLNRTKIILISINYMITFKK